MVVKRQVEVDYYEQMRALKHCYDEINEEVILLKSRMHALLHLSFPEPEKLITLSSALFLNIVQLYPHLALLLAHSKVVIKNRLKANTRKNLSLVRAEVKAEVLLEVAHNIMVITISELVMRIHNRLVQTFRKK
ncbi:MAG: hypothetical protein ABS948_07925 [Solibacillus sp.]